MNKASLHISLLMLATFALISCGNGEEPATDDQQQQAAITTIKDLYAAAEVDLIPLHSYIRHLHDTGEILFTPEHVDNHLYEGWANPFAARVDGATEPAADEAPVDENAAPPADVPVIPTTVMIDKTAVLSYDVFNPAARELVFDARSTGQFGGANYNQISIKAGEQLLQRIELSPEKQEYRIAIPAAVQSRGKNFITFEASILTENENWLTRRKDHNQFPYPYICGYFTDFSFEIVSDDEALVPETLNSDELDLQVFEETGYLLQRANSRMTYAWPLRQKATLSVAGELQKEGALEEEITLSVLARSDDNPDYQVLWSETYTLNATALSQSIAAEVDLAAFENLLADITVQISSNDIHSRAAAFWKELKLQQSEKPAEATRPEPVRLTGDTVQNIIYIVMDAARADVYGANGSTIEASPNIDAFTEDALIFPNGSVSAPYTITSVSSLFTGLEPETHGVRNVTQVFPSDLDNMPAAFRRAGWYTVVMAGTQFLEPHYQLSEDAETIYFLRRPEYKEQQQPTMDLEEIRRGFEDVALASADGQRSFVYAHLLPPHWPYNPPGEFNQMFTAGMGEPTLKRSWQITDAVRAGQLDRQSRDVRIYRQMYNNNVMYADYVVGEMLKYLKELDLYENSMIVITSDHGETFGEHKEFGHNTSTYEHMINVPLFVKVPGVEPQVIEHQVGWIDIFPTFAELFELEVEGIDFQGRSVAPLFIGQDMPLGDYHYARCTGDALFWGLRGETFKYMMRGPKEFLFNYKEDPQELTDLKEVYPVLTAELRQRGLFMIRNNRAHSAEDVELTEEEKQDLRNLGYLQ